MNKRSLMVIKSVNNFTDFLQTLMVETGRLFLLLGSLIRKSYYLMLHPRYFLEYYWELLLDQMVRVGVNSIPVVATTALFTGMVLAVQTGVTLEAKIQGSSIFVGNIVNLSLVRELGPVLTAILVTGRIGSAMAAEIGSMKITEQIDALRTLATDPIEYIGVPRFLAVIVMIPMLTIMANVLGSIGGWIVATFHLGISSTIYWEGAQATLEMGDVISGLSKSFFFAVILAIFALYRGFQTTGGAVGVGKATTNAVVNASITILIADYFLTQLYALF